MTLAASHVGHSTYIPQLQTSTIHHSASQSQRPRNLSELAVLAKDEVGWDPSLRVTHWLHKAEEFRERALTAEQRQDIETTWIELSKSTEILHHLKGHQGYRTYFTDSQRSNMTKNFESMMKKLEQLKPVIVDRCDSWTRRNPIQETSEDERRKEDERRREREALDRKQFREEMQRRVEVDLLRRREEIARKEREAREAREGQLRRHAETQNKYQQNQQMRERTQESKPATKYSKASDSANAGPMEAEKERERRKQTRLEVERQQQQQQQQLANTPVASAFPTSTRDIRGSQPVQVSHSSASLAAAAPKPDDDVVLVGNSRHTRQRSRQSSLMDRSPNSVSAQPSSGSEQYLSVSPGMTISVGRTPPSSGSQSGPSPNMAPTSHGTRRPSLSHSATVPPSFPQSVSRESVYSRGENGHGSHNESAGPPGVQPNSLRRENTAPVPTSQSQTQYSPASQAANSRPSNASSTVYIQQSHPSQSSRPVYRQPTVILEDLSAKDVNPSKVEIGGLSRTATQIVDHYTEGPDNVRHQAITSRASAAVVHSQTLPADLNAAQQNMYHRNVGDGSVNPAATTSGNTHTRQNAISKQNPVNITRGSDHDDTSPYKQRHSSVSRAQTMPDTSDQPPTGFIPPPPADLSSTPSNPRSVRQSTRPSKLDTNVSRTLAQGEGVTTQNLSASSTSYATRHGVSATVSEATVTPPTSFAIAPYPAGKPSISDQISPTPYKESKLAAQYRLPKPPQPAGLLDKGKGVDKSLVEQSSHPVVTSTGVSRGGSRPPMSKEDRVRDHNIRTSALPGLSYTLESGAGSDSDPNFLSASNSRPALSRQSSSSQISRSKSNRPQEDSEHHRETVAGRFARMEIVEDRTTPSSTGVSGLRSSSRYRGDNSGSGSDSVGMREGRDSRRASSQAHPQSLVGSSGEARLQHIAPLEDTNSSHSPQAPRHFSSSHQRQSSGPRHSANGDAVSLRSLEKRPAEPEINRHRKPKLLSEAGSDRSIGEDDHIPQSRGEFASRPPSAGVTYDSLSESGGAPLNRHIGLPTIHPLQSPRRWAGDESSTDEQGRKLPPLPTWGKHGHKKSDDERETASIQGPPPMTTTSPRPPHSTPVPPQRLMNSHQLSQGYAPSLNSMVSNLQEHLPIQQSTLLSNRAFQFSEKNLSPQNPYPRRPGKASQMPVQLMDPRSQQENARVRNFDTRKDRPMPNLKPVEVPRDILKRFMALSAENTELQRETLGLMMGKIKSEKYVVTTLLIPNQSGGADWCTMEDDDMIVHFQERRFLVTLGWIHTHPSQTCFMSSCDLHTHAPYQKMLPEAFAIVCSPKYEPSFGVFRLTDPPGLRYVLDCKKPEMFHQHDVPNLYTDCDSAHVSLVDGIGLEICDIRRHREIS